MKHLRKTLVWVMLLVAGTVSAVSSVDRYNIKRALEAIQVQDWETGVSFLTQELRENPDNGYAYAYLAAVCDMMTGYNSAMFAFAKKAIPLLPKNEGFLKAGMEGLQAQIYQQADDTVKAIEHLKQAIAYNAGDAKYYGYLADVLDDQKEYQEMVAMGENMINRVKGMKKEVMSYIIITSGLNGLKRYDEAIEYADKGLKLKDLSKPQQGIMHAAKAKALIGKKQYDAALDEALLTAELAQAKGMQLLIQIADSSDMQVVLDSMEVRFAAHPSEGLWAMAQSDIYAHHHNYVQAIYQLIRGAKVEDSSYGYRAAGYYAVHLMGDPEMGEQLYMKALEIDSTNVLALCHLADLYRYQARHEEALRTLDRVLELDPEQKHTFFFHGVRGRVYKSMHNYSRAIEEYYRALVSANDEDSWAGIASIYKQMGDEESAQKAIELGLREMKNDTTMDMLLAMGDTIRAREKAPKMIRREDSENQQYNAACMYSRMKMPEEALAALRKAMDCGFRNFLHMAWDDDLDNIRQLPEFNALIEEYKAITKREQEELKNLLSTL